MSRKFAEEVSQMFIKKLSEGKAPWQLPWKAGQPGAVKDGMPYNPVSRRGYRGINNLWLSIQDFEDQRWVTARQADSVGAMVKKGEQGTQVVYYRFNDKQDVKDNNGNVIVDKKGRPLKEDVMLSRPRVFVSTVFNAEQIDGPLPVLSANQQRTEHEAIELADEAIQGSGADIRHQSIGAAYYVPTHDYIVVPPQSDFHTTAGYYATLLHELGHWTGHPDRLNRDLSGRMNGIGESKEKYAKEELRAEIASYMMGMRFGIGHDPSNHVAYVGGWIKALQDDPYEIQRAATAAEKICTYVIGLSPTLQAEMDAEADLADRYEAERKVAAIRDENGRLPQREYLNVPKTEKDEAKALGARWDKEAVSWYVPAGIDATKKIGLDRWSIAPKELDAPANAEPVDQEHVYTVSVAYEVFTDESAEYGEAHSRGFDLVQQNYSLEDLQALIGEYGFTGASASHVSQGIWLKTLDPVEDRAFFEDGEKKYFSLHLNKVDGAEPTMDDFADLMRMAKINFPNDRLEAFGTKIPAEVVEEDQSNDSEFSY